MKNNFYTLEMNQGKLVYTPEHKHSLQTYAIEWLASWRNTYFFKWDQFSLGNKISLYTDIDGLIPFEKFLATANTKDLYSSISYICEILREIENTILDQNKILFDMRYIFVQEYKRKDSSDKILGHGNRYIIKLVYVPDKIFSLNKDNDSLKILFSTLANLIIKKDSRKKFKDYQQKLLLAIEENDIEAISTLSQAYSKPSNNINFKKIINVSDSIQKLEKIDLPKIILIIIIALISSIFIIDKQLGYIKKTHLIIILGLITMNLIFEFILLFSPESPFRIIDYTDLKTKSKNKNSILEHEENKSIKTDGVGSNLHPLSQYRIGQLKLFDGATHISGKNSWNIAGSEFLMGTDKNCDLILPIISSEPTLLRIIQRSGTFFLESLSKDINIKIENRHINRYQEYEISNFIKFSIDRFTFSLEIN